MRPEKVMKQLNEIFVPVLENIREVKGVRYTRSLHAAVSLALGFRACGGLCGELTGGRRETVEFIMKESLAAAVSALAEATEDEDNFVKDFCMLTDKLVQVEDAA